MRIKQIVEGLCAFIHGYYTPPELQKPHCVRIEKGVTLPTGDLADVLALRHVYLEQNKPKPHVFSVDAFVVTTGVITIGTVQRASQCVAALRTWNQGRAYHDYAEGYRSDYQISFHAVCVGTRLSNAPLIQKWLAPWGQMSFWTYSVSGQGVDFRIDNYGTDVTLPHSDAPLRRLLDHLPRVEDLK